MTFAKLLQNTELLSKRTGISIAWVLEHEPRFVKDGYFISIFEFTTLISPYDGLIDESAIAREIFHDCHGLPILVLAKDEAMPVRYCGKFKLAICFLSAYG